MARRRALVASLIVLAVACRSREPSSSNPEPKDPAASEVPASPPRIDPRPLGVPTLDAFRWRARGGHAKFREARSAESRADWSSVVTHARAALAIDPTHAEAAWLLAAALGRLGRTDELLAPLAQAVAIDFGKWGAASLELEALAAFRATPVGRAWAERVRADREIFTAMLGRSTLVHADGELFAVERDSGRWIRLTRTAGAVIAALRAGKDRVIYVARTTTSTRQGSSSTVPGERAGRSYALGVIDLAAGITTRPADVGPEVPFTVAYSARAPAGVWVGRGRPRLRWHHLDGARGLVPLPPATRAPAGARIDVTGSRAQLVATPSSLVTADWDDAGLASALRIETSNRVVAPPSPALIDGASVTWSGDRAHLAFAVQLDDTCADGASTAAALVAEATTGKVTELVRSTRGVAVEWVGEGILAVAGDDGVSWMHLDGSPPRSIPGATDLVTPRRRPRCVVDDAADDAPITPLSRLDEEADVPLVEPPAPVSSSPPLRP